MNLESNNIFKWIAILLTIIFLIPFVYIIFYDIRGFNARGLYMFRLSNIKDFYTFWITLFGAVGLMINIYLTQKRVTNQEKQLQKQSEQIMLQDKSQRDSRFSKGIELLGNVNESARTGGAYSLCFLAKEYPTDFAKPVFEILCSHIRTLTSSWAYKTEHAINPSNEVQSIMGLLFREGTFTLYLSNAYVDLSNCYFRGISLSEANLENVNFSYTHLENSHLYKANLRGTKLNFAYLSESILAEANMEYAEINQGLMANTIFMGAKMDSVQIKGCDVSASDFSSATLTNALMYNSNFKYVRFIGADLSGASLGNTDFSHSQFIRTKLYHTTFFLDTVLDEVDMKKMDLTDIIGEINPKYLDPKTS